MNNHEISTIAMKEYEMLRMEIMERQKRREQIIILMITFLGFIWSFLLKQSGVPFLLISFVPYLIIFSISGVYSTYSGHVVNMGMYLLHFLESRFPTSLHWEKEWNEHVKRRRESGKGLHGYWYWFSLFATWGSCMGTIILVLFTDKLQPLGLSPIYVVGADAAATWTYPPTMACIIAVVHVGAAVWCTHQIKNKLHWSKRNALHRQRYDEWEQRKRLYEPNGWDWH